MSIIVTDETVAALTIAGVSKVIAKDLANVSGEASASKQCYLANRAGLSLDELAKATSKLLAADPLSKKSSISKAAMEQRVSGYAFLQENGLSTLPRTVGLAYTLAQKPTKAEEYSRVLANFADPTNKKTLDVLLAEAIKRANEAIKAKKQNKSSEGGEESEEGSKDNQSAAGILKDTAGQITAYLRAQSTRKDFSAKDKAMMLKAAQEFINTLV
jgi:hypothetical protein